MKIGVRKSPHLDTVLEGMRLDRDVQLVSEYDTGADFYLCWGWPQAEQVARDNGGRDERIICVDAHPFALRAGDRSGARVFQLGNWGFLAKYPPVRDLEPVPVTEDRSVEGGPLLVLGHVGSTEQQRQGLVDVWFTPGGDAWIKREMCKPLRKFRPHPRAWTEPRPQPSLEDDLAGCSGAIAWNSTAVLHARMLGYPAWGIEDHAWGHFELEWLAGTRVKQPELRNGAYWRTVYRPWLESLSENLSAVGSSASSRTFAHGPRGL